MEFDVVFGSGTGGQKPFIVPDLNMIIVVTAQAFGNPRGPVGTTELLTDYVIPAALPVFPEVSSKRPTAAFLNAAVGKYFNEKRAHMAGVVQENETLL